MKHKVAELEGALLDAAVARAEGWEPNAGGGWHVPGLAAIGVDEAEPCVHFEFEPLGWSGNWSAGGPIIERERIIVWPTTIFVEPLDACQPDEQRQQWAALHPKSRGLGGWTDGEGGVDVTARDGMPGSTPLIAAMRAYCAAKLGADVEIP